MKFSEYLTLKEDEGGGAGGEGAAAPAVSSSDNNDAGSTGADTNDDDSSDDATTGMADLEKHTQTGSSTVNMAGWYAPIGMISRLAMPQIPREMYGEFLNDLKLNKIKHRKCTAKACNLIPTQGELNTDKVNSIKKSMEDGNYNGDPILVAASKDEKHIADGHHRWAAYNEKDDVPIHQIDLPFDDLYKFLDNKPYVVKRSIKQ